jgi:hypothetical protein
MQFKPILNVKSMPTPSKTSGEKKRIDPVGKRRRLAVFLIVAFVLVGMGGYMWWSARRAAFDSLPAAAKVEGVPKEVRALMDEWMRPQEGRIAGQVVGMDDFGIVIEGFDGNFWYAVSNPGEVPGRDEHAVFLAKVRVIGELAEGRNFTAKEFMPWEEFSAINEPAVE